MTEEAWIIVYKADGDDLNLTTRHVGPFASHDEAYDALCELPAPINGGHKFIQELEQPTGVSRRIDDQCSTHKRNPEPGHRCDTCHRIRIEMTIVRKTAGALIDAGYFVSVNDGDETTVMDSRMVSEIMAAVFTTDEDYFYARREATGKDRDYDSFVRFIYGNDGPDVINDYSTSLESVMRPVLDYCDTLDVYA